MITNCSKEKRNFFKEPDNSEIETLELIKGIRKGNKSDLKDFSIPDRIGNTPLIKIKRLTAGNISPDVNLCAKADKHVRI